MNKKDKIVLISFVLLCCIAALTVRFVWPRNHLEIQVYDFKASPDGKRTAVVQLEVYDAGWVVSNAVYAVRLKGAHQRDAKGDLVMNVPVNYPDPEPHIDWNNEKLVVSLAEHQKYQYFATPTDGVAIVLQQRK
jgi:hypothetical protein